MSCSSFVVKAIITNLALCNAKIIWDNNADIVYPEHDVTARDDEVRFPNWVFIYPGTKWCGAGNISSSYDDLGELEDVDKCCRSHDSCNDTITAFKSKYNLTNLSFITRVHCDCDNEFHSCLKGVDTNSATQIGVTYFQLLNTRCFRKEYPIKRCTAYTYFPIKKCVQYAFDKSKEKIYQWFDVPNY